MGPLSITPELAYLVIPHPDGARNVPLEHGNTWRLGRTGDNRIVVPNEWVSRQHALVQRIENGQYYLFDLGSRNGTFLNGVRVTVPVPLNDGDRISLGDFDISFHCPVQVEQASEPFMNPAGMPTANFFALKKITVL